jgi:hypothetical protein
MNIFDKITEELKEMRTYINNKEPSRYTFRDFDNLNYNAKKMYDNKYGKKEEYANILYQLCCFFEVFFNNLPISIPEDKIYPSDKKKIETKIEFNTNVLLLTSFIVLDKNRLIKPEINEEKDRMKVQILNGFLNDFKNNEFKFEAKMVLNYFTQIVSI